MLSGLGSFLGQIVAGRQAAVAKDQARGDFHAPYVKRSRGYLLIDENDNFTGNGTSSDFTAWQQQVTKAANSGIELRFPYSAVTRIDAPIVVPNGKALKLRGAGVQPQTMLNAGSGISPMGIGSILYFDHSGIGIRMDADLPTEAWNPGSQGNDFRDFGVMRNQPAPRTGWAPAQTLADFDFSRSTAYFDRVHFHNSTNGIAFHAGNQPGGLVIGAITGQFFNTALFVEACYGFLDVGSIIAEPYWSEDPAVTKYMLQNAVIARLQRVDDATIRVLKCFQASRLVEIGMYAGNGTYPGGTASNLQIVSMFADSCLTGYCVDSAVKSHTADIGIFGMQQDVGVDTSPAPGLFVGGTSNLVKVGSFAAQFTRGANLSVAGITNHVMVGLFQEGEWNMYRQTGGSLGSSAIPCVQDTGTNCMIEIDKYRQGGSGNGGPRTSGNVNATLSEGTLSETPNQNGVITWAHRAGQIPTFLDIQGLTGAATIYQLQSLTATDVTYQFQDRLGRPITTPISFGWRALMRANRPF
jgi:hypothetical protein